MKTRTIIIALLVGFVTALPGTAVSTDAPHNASRMISCSDCHSLHAMPYSDALCLSCHTNAAGGGYTKTSAPREVTHASDSTYDRYGTWSTTCISCHSQHLQDQTAAYGTASYLVTGTISAVTDNGDGTTTFGYMNLVEHIAGWGDPATWGRKSTGNASAGNERGLILFANTADPAVSFEVLSATPTAMTVQGSLDAAFPGAVTPGSSFAITYGQLIKAGVLSAGSVTRSVTFSQNSAANSFANSGSPSPDGICQVCHTRTGFWRFDGTLTGHYGGTNCTRCHRHEEGFKPSCDICHDAPPATGTHAMHVTGPVTYYSSTRNRSTPAAYGYGCGICHQGTHLNTTADPRTVETVFAGIAIQDSAATAAYAPAAFSVDDPGTGYTFNTSDGTCSTVYCHGNYPGSGRNASVRWSSGSAPCGSCHGATNEDYPYSGTHFLHVGDGRSSSCTLCHKDSVIGAGPGTYTIADKTRHVNGFVDWKFDTTDPRVSLDSLYSIPSGTAMPSDGDNPRAYGTCSKIYCHSIGQTATGGPLSGAPGEYATPIWGRSSGSASCGICHKNGSHHNSGRPAAMDSGSHAKHLSYDFLTLNNRYAGSYKCAICHRYESQAAGTYKRCDSCHTTSALYARHADGKVTMQFDTAFGAATYNDTSANPGTPGNGYFSCSNTYCHSNGTSVSTGVVPANVSTAWGSGVVSCDACHGYPPSYPNGAPKRNSHPAHEAEPCSRCHVTTTANGSSIASFVNHVNKAYNVAPETVSGVTFTYTFAASGGSCTNVSCHGGGTARWGSTLTCQSCHLGAIDVDDFTGLFYDNGITSKIAQTGAWNATGHGRVSGVYASGNPAASFTATNACLYCHDGAVAHKTAANPFRLRNIADAAWDLNGACQSCHAAGSSGVTVDSVLKNGTRKVGSTHYGARHTSAANGGRFCWDCHDPHGDGNLFMVQNAVAKTSDAATGAPRSLVTTSFVTFATGTGYATSASPYTGICNVCHSTTNHYTSTSGDGHNADTRCTQCHAHTRDSRDNAFQAACDACHGNPPADNATLVGFVLPSSTGSVTAGAHAFHVNTRQIACDACHADSAGSGTTHNNGDLRVTLGFSLFSGAYRGGGYDGQTTVSYNVSTLSTMVTNSGTLSCSNIYCHGATLAPDGGTDITPVWNDPSTAACGSCHGATAAAAPTRGAHYRHTAPYTDIGHEYPCTWCHQDTVADPLRHANNRSEVVFSTHPAVTGGTYSGTPAVLDAYGNCSNVYCHSSVQTSPPGGPLTYRTINWGSSYGGDFACNLCHEGPEDHYSTPLGGNNSGSHPKHEAYRIYCSTCHANDITEDPDPDSPSWGCYGCHTWNGPNVTHANHAVDVNIVTKYSGTYSGTPAPGDAYGSCASTYCHSSGVSVRTAVIPDSGTAAWGSGALACSACHGNAAAPAPHNAMPDYPNGSPKENSHAAHVISNSIPCQSCHAGTTTDGTTIANRSLHVNKTYDLRAGGTFNGAAVSFTYAPATVSAPGSCSSISCHGGTSAVWGGTY